MGKLEGILLIVHMRTISDMSEFKDVHDIQGYHSYHVLSALTF